MSPTQIILAALTAIILFIFSLESFSKEIQRVSGEKFRLFLARATKIPVIGVVLGAVITALIQSSSATSVIVIGLVNAGVLTFKNSVGVIVGANIGSTVTAQLVALKLTDFAPYIIIAGFFLSLFRWRLRDFAKVLFYFGFIFFCLNLISATLGPLQQRPDITALLATPYHPLIAILMGALFTALIQSSSVTSGLAIILVQQQVLGLENAIPLIIGANLGTTFTAMIVIYNMDLSAKKTALAHLLFNFVGVLLFIPLILTNPSWLVTTSDDPATYLANFHLLFNVSTSIIFLIFITPFTKLIEKILGEGKLDFERFDLDSLKPTSEAATFESYYQFIHQALHKALPFLKENYNLMSLSIETNYQGIYESSLKRLAYFNHLKTQFFNSFSNLATLSKSAAESEQLFRLMNLHEYLFQVHDSIEDLANVKKSLDDSYTELSSDYVIALRDLSGKTLQLFQKVILYLSPQEPKQDSQPGPGGEESAITQESLKNQIKDLGHEIQVISNKINKEVFKNLKDDQESTKAKPDSGFMLHFLTFNQRLKDKLLNLTSI